MALIGSEVRVHFRYTYLGQQNQNIQSYICQGAAWATATMDNLLEALWNDYKARLRALTSTSAAVGTWDSLLGEEIGGGLQFAEFPIPTAERVGTRAAGDDGDWVSGIMAVGFRQTVATRLTRPGQKRFPFLREGDLAGNALMASVITLYTPVATAFSNPSALGIPVLGGALQPIVVHEPGMRDPVRRIQDVTGFVLNSNVTSQVSRKAGHGS